jgi:hypothetical protein
MMGFQKKSHFVRDIRKRFALRLHMAAILIATACSGVLASKLLLWAGLDSLAIRYPLSVLFAYLVFFVCVKLWLVYVTPKKHTGGSLLSDWLDVPDLVGSGSGGSSGGGGIPPFRPGGGQFGGAGASRSFDLPVAGITEDSGVVGEAVSGAAGGLGDAVGEAASALGDEGGIAAIVVVAVLVALVATVLGSTVYVIYEAPMILSEAAFEGLLAATLIRGTRKIDSGDWVGSIFSTTWKPFLVTLIMALVTGSLLNYYFPEASRIVEILRRG